MSQHDSYPPGGASILDELKEVFYPRTIAVVGASNNEKKMGHRNLEFPLQFGFRGRIYPVNPNEATVLGLTSYPSVSAIPEDVDRAIVSVPAHLVPAVLKDCARKGVKIVQICTAGFAEVEGEGTRLQEKILEIARGSGMRLIGPNCMGTYCADSLMTYVFPDGSASEPGNVAFVSQSGGISAMILVRGKSSGIRFSKVISVGQCIDLNMADYLEYFMEDPCTEIPAFYIEGLRGEGRRFFELLKVAARKKPVIILRGGTTEAGRHAVASHSGAMASNELVWDALFKQTGAVQVTSIDDLVNTMVAFRYIKRVRGRRVAIIGNGGGASILASDVCSRLGLEIRPFSPATLEKIARLPLPPTLSVQNPFDTPAPVLEQEDGKVIEQTIDFISQDENVDTILFHINLVPLNAFGTIYTVTHNTVQALSKVSERTGIPVLLVFHHCGDLDLEMIIHAEEEKARRGGLAVFPTLEDACKGLAKVIEYRESLGKQGVDDREMRKAETDQGAVVVTERDRANAIVAAALEQGRTFLSAEECTEILTIYGVPSPRTILATSLGQACEAVGLLGLPLVMKIASEDIVHKSDVGGVRVGISSERDLQDAYEAMMASVREKCPTARIAGVLLQPMVKGLQEAIVGLKRDPVFGPVVLLGLGGVWVELLRDVSVRICPVGRADVWEMLGELKGYPLLAGFRGSTPADVEALVDLTLRLSRMGMDIPQLVEMDLNPVMLHPQGKGCTAVDCRIILAPTR